MTTKNEEFLQKLKSLLQEYNASIDWTCAPCSDMHGVYDDHLEIMIGDKTIFEAQSSYITSNELP